jgi:hypothetical protein
VSSNRLAIGQSLQAFLAGVQNPNTSAALYGISKLGNVFDPTAYSSFVEITYLRGTSMPAGSGGNLIGWRIDEEIQFLITSGWDYEQDSTAAMVNMLTAMDILVPTLHQHYQLPQASNQSLAIQSVYSFLVEPHDRSRIARFPNGRVYILWDCYVTVKQQYGVNQINP